MVRDPSEGFADSGPHAPLGSDLGFGVASRSKLIETIGLFMARPYATLQSSLHPEHP